MSTPAVIDIASAHTKDPFNVRFAPKATEVLRCRELTRWETGLPRFR